VLLVEIKSSFPSLAAPTVSNRKRSRPALRSTPSKRRISPLEAISHAIAVMRRSKG
jgi:hypothetical protein